MSRDDPDPPAFEGGSTVPVATYLLTVAALSAFALASAGDSPAPVLGVAWGLVLAALAVGALRVEGVRPRSVLPPARSLLAAVAVVGGFWAAYNLVAAGLALGGVAGFEPAPSRVAAHPLPYLAAFASSLAFTAFPEELMFRAYLQSRLVELVGDGRRAVATGVAVAAVPFALFHLPRWFLLSGHGVGPALAVRLFWLTVAGLAYGTAYALTRNLWLVALFHAATNQPPLLVAGDVPAGLHPVVGVVEYAGIVAAAFVAARATGSDGTAVARSRAASSPDD